MQQMGDADAQIAIEQSEYHQQKHEQFLMKTLNLIRFRSEDCLTFTKFGGDGWGESSISSCHYYLSGVHKFSVKIIKSALQHLMIGVFNDKFNFRGNYIGSDEYSCSYYGNNGNKYARSTNIEYGVKAQTGDTIDLLLNLNTTYGTVEYFRNDLPMGIAFSGVKSLGKLYFGVSSYSNQDTFTISYKLIQK